ncbi:hypothetical protein [Methylobacterium oxalidis]|uniref:hypothetical protein n=1 Tax=Methylobacterium oxalidis TaxID=944322 RepID=UPI0033151310
MLRLVPLAYLLFIIALLVWLVPVQLASRMNWAAGRTNERDAADADEALACELKAARKRITCLEGELAEARRRLAARPEADDPLYRRVGLNEGCPDFVVVSARRAFRAALHPDRHPEARKPAAQARFVAAEEAFTAIYKRRGL